MTDDHKADPLDLDALEAIARKATPGPWFSDLRYGREGYFLSEASDQLGITEFTRDTEHIANFDPPTVLALLAALKEAQEQLAELFESVADYDNARSGQPGVDWTHIQRVAEAVRAINRSEAP